MNLLLRRARSPNCFISHPDPGTPDRTRKHPLEPDRPNSEAESGAHPHAPASREGVFRPRPAGRDRRPSGAPPTTGGTPSPTFTDASRITRPQQSKPRTTIPLDLRCVRHSATRGFHAIDTQPLSEMSNRALVDPVLFRVLYATGLRLSEALNLQLRDVDAARATLEVRDSKNREHRIAPVTRRLAATLESYVAAAHPDPEPAHHLFHTGDPATPADKSTIYNRLRRYLADADIPHFAPGGPHIHSLRHGFAVQNLRRWAADGSDLAVMLPYLSAYMGHSDLRGTQYYLQLTADAYPDVAEMVQARFGYVIPNPVAREGGDQ
jgi:hypothetical protein